MNVRRPSLLPCQERMNEWMAAWPTPALGPMPAPPPKTLIFISPFSQSPSRISASFCLPPLLPFFASQQVACMPSQDVYPRQSAFLDLSVYVLSLADSYIVKLVAFFQGSITLCLRPTRVFGSCHWECI